MRTDIEWLHARWLGPQACGLYPSIGRLQESKPGAKNQRPAIITRKDEKIVIHPSSVNSAIELPPPPEGAQPTSAMLTANKKLMTNQCSYIICLH